MVSLLGAVVVAVAPPLLWSGAAGADPIGAAQAQIGAVTREISGAASRVHQLTAAFDQANLTAATTAQQLLADEGTLAAAQRRLAGSRQALRQEALQSYTGGAGGTVETTAAVASDPGVSGAYIEVAAGNLTDSVDQYHLQQQQLQAAVAAVTDQQQANQRAVAATAAARDAALREAGTAQGHLAALEDELNRLVAAQAAAAAAARAAAPPAPAQGGPVNNGLVAVVVTIVRTPTPAPVSAGVPPVPTASVPASPARSVAAPATTVVAPPPAPAAPTTATTGGGGAGGPWLQLRECESGNNYQADTGNGFYGAYQFSASTWNNLGYPGRPDQEPPAMQDEAAMRLQSQAGWGQWPACSAALGLS